MKESNSMYLFVIFNQCPSKATDVNSLLVNDWMQKECNASAYLFVNWDTKGHQKPMKTGSRSISEATFLAMNSICLMTYTTRFSILKEFQNEFWWN